MKLVLFTLPNLTELLLELHEVIHVKRVDLHNCMLIILRLWGPRERCWSRGGYLRVSLVYTINKEVCTLLWQSVGVKGTF